MHTPLLWADIETDGLDPYKNRIFEVGMIITDEDLREVASFNVVLGWRNVHEAPNADPYALKLHTRNGLIKEVEVANLCVRQAEERLVRWMDKHGANGMLLAGSGVHFDRKWLEVHMPRIPRRLHHRNFDVNTLRYFFGADKTEAPHRALGDLRQNLTDLRNYVAQARVAGLIAMPKKVAAVKALA